MTDQTLAQIVKAAEAAPDDAVTLAALSDRLQDASPEDRMECLRAWCGAKARAEKAERELAAPRPVPNFAAQTFSLSGGETWRASMGVPSRDDGSYDYVAAARGELRERACLALADQSQDGQWYAVRITTRPLPRPHPMADREIEAEMRVVPMGGAGLRRVAAG